MDSGRQIIFAGVVIVFNDNIQTKINRLNKTQNTAQNLLHLSRIYLFFEPNKIYDIENRQHKSTYN